MPEGDSVLRTARLLDRLSGEVLEVAHLRWPSVAHVDLTGRRVLETISVGKHLLTRLDAASARPALTLHTHLRMDGSWRVWPAGTRSVPGPRSDARAVLGTATWLAVGFSLGMVDVVRTEHEHTLVGHLGPDILGPGWDPAEALDRLRHTAHRNIGAALLDQRNLAGLGTYWASEALFLQGIHPDADIADLVAMPDAPASASAFPLGRMVERLPALLGVERRPEPFVYGRTRRPCRRCRTPIARITVGTPPHPRDLFYCPHCQPSQ